MFFTAYFLITKSILIHAVLLCSHANALSYFVVPIGLLSLLSQGGWPWTLIVVTLVTAMPFFHDEISIKHGTKGNNLSLALPSLSKDLLPVGNKVELHIFVTGRLDRLIAKGLQPQLGIWGGAARSIASTSFPMHQQWPILETSARLLSRRDLSMRSNAESLITNVLVYLTCQGKCGKGFLWTYAHSSTWPSGVFGPIATVTK